MTDRGTTDNIDNVTLFPGVTEYDTPQEPQTGAREPVDVVIIIEPPKPPVAAAVGAELVFCVLIFLAVIGAGSLLLG